VLTSRRLSPLQKCRNLLDDVKTEGWLWRVNPEIYVARSRLTGQGTKSWDRVLLSVLLASFLATLVVAALDDGRFH
jgi:hypothetical protein